MITAKSKFGWVPALLCAACVGWWSARALHAADDGSGDSGKTKSATDERQDEERKLTTSKYGNFTGTIKLLSEAEIQARGDELVIAKFTTLGKELFLKPDTDQVKAEIKKSDGQALTLKGKALPEGKYMFVLKSVEVGPGNGFVAPLGGL
jgi:hypothetical protein